MQIMALEQSTKRQIEASNGHDMDKIHESRAVSRLRLPRVNGGEWPEMAEWRQKEERRLGKTGFQAAR